MWGNDFRLDDCLNGSYKSVGFVAEVNIPMIVNNKTVWQKVFLMDKERPNETDFSYSLFISKVVARGSHALFSTRLSAESEAKRLYYSLKKKKDLEDCIPFDQFFIGLKKIEFQYSMKIVE